MVTTPVGNGTDCLIGGGELGALMRAHDWSKTPLGTPDRWPQSLRSAVSILLPSRAQICLFWGPDLVALYNDAYRPALGIKHPWALGRPAREVWREFWEDVLRPLLEQVVNTGAAFWASDYPFFLERHGYPEETYFDISYDPVRDESGDVGGVFCIVSETTGRVVGERRLRILRDVTRVAGEAQDTDDAFRRVAAALSTAPHDLPFALLYRPVRGADFHCVGAAGIGHMPPEPWPLASVAAARQELVVDCSARPDLPRLPAGPWPEPARTAVILPIMGTAQILGILVAGVSPRRPLDDGYRDFLRLLAANTALAVGTAQALAEERARASALAELDRAKTAFFSNVSHEFRTPLTLMIGPVEDLLNDAAPALPASHREKLELAHRNALRLLKLVNTLLDFSRIEAGRIEATYTPTDLGPHTAELASVFRSAIEKAGLRLLVDTPPLPEPIFVDREMWEKIVLNLLSNAFKFTFAGEISVRLSWRGDGAELIVRDTGTGIEREHLPHLFERFYRVPNAKARTHEGSGIGLALVHELVKLQGGTIRVDSTPGSGSCFTIRLPAGTAHLPPDRIGAPKALASTSIRRDAFVDEIAGHSTAPMIGDGASSDPVPHSSEVPGRILWADDNADMREYVRRILAPYWQVEAVADGRAALESVRRTPPDLVLADIMMPGLDGFALLRQLRGDDATRGIPVILLSARAGEEAKVEGLDAGADDYLIKPFSARELIARVLTHLKMRQVREELAAKHSESNAWFRLAVRAARLGIWHADPATWEAGGDATLMTLLGLDPQRTSLSAAEWKQLIHPDDRRRVVDAFAATAAGSKPLDVEFRIVHPDGTVRWLASHGDLIRPRERHPPRIVGVGQDITEQKEAAATQQLLVEELNHRVRNTLATVLSLSRQTALNTDNMETFLTSFQSRLVALSGAHGLLTRHNWKAVSLRELVEEILAPHRGAGTIHLSGPDCDLVPRHALALTLGLHELATNACKYGALTSPAGRIDVAWHLRAAGRERSLHMTWAEQGGPRVNPPKRRGFGSKLIEHAMALDLKGDVHLDFSPDGIRCRISFSMDDSSVVPLALHHDVASTG